ncbi:MAG TPA: DNA primase [Candidatus Coproplasma stercoripullorum]|uniref:DNA primase n=1 Tax=Candidatus Coproplasma stercoripullorum TaxID=2840751 RepID=A0A9D1AHN8_9FIRM|nr:DNA primase [Candidatus Coproplasma stercoripullorum]
MANGFDKDFLNLLTDKLNIVDVASSYMHLEKKGGTYWACCPFHHEKTASFHIDENRQFYHCFGCGVSGNVITLVKEMENVDFVDAVKMLAERANLPLPKTTFDGERAAEVKRKRDTLLKIMNDCAHFYLDNLNSGKAEAHINYILSREIPAGVVRSFGLGASLNYSDLPKFLLAKGYSKQDIIDSGAVNEVEGRLSDAQGGRLIFPIINQFDEVVAFGGRALKKTDFAKYKNTKETLIFNKSKMLYNINRLKKLRRAGGLKEVIMVEGYMDTVSLHQGGFKNVVASMGTSLTQEQARLIKRYCSTVLISYDGDSAGQKANMRGLEILKSEGIDVRVVPLPDGLDPDDVIKKLGAEEYRKCLDSAMPLIDYKMKVARMGYDLNKPEDKVKYVGDALKVVRSAESAAERELLLKNLRDETGISFEALSRDLQQVPAERQERSEEKPKMAEDSADVNKKASRFVAAAFLFGADYTGGVDVDGVPFADDVHKLIASYVKSKMLFGEKITLSEIFDFFEEGTPEYEELCRVLDLNDGENLNGDVQRRYFDDCLRRLRSDRITKAIDEVKRQYAAADDVEEKRRAAEVLQQLIEQKEKLKSGDIR